jgi:dihydrofolate reductase
MRKVVVFNRLSVGGFYAGPKGEIDWFIPNPEADKAVHKGARVDTALFGRVTYQLFERHWPHVKKNPNASKKVEKTCHNP